jgi:OmpA-OmpF porin, OOP family
MNNAIRWIVALSVLAAPGVTAAENFYGAVRGGPAITTDTSHRGFLGDEGDLEFKTGLTASAAVGYSFPFGLRVEGEGGYLYAPVKRDFGVEVDGSVKSYLFMANAYYDLKLGKFKPYVGLGIGGARLHHDHEVFVDTRSVVLFGGTGPSGPVGVKVELDEWRTAFAYQARAGLLYDVNQWLDLSLGYRFVNIEGGHVDHAFGRTRFGAIKNHSLELGFAVKF